MKKIFTLSILAFAALSSNAQLPVSTTPSLKNAILEEFTGIHCVYCPDGHKIAAQIAANNPNRAFTVNIHTGGFATPSAMYLCSVAGAGSRVTVSLHDQYFHAIRNILFQLH